VITAKTLLAGGLLLGALSCTEGNAPSQPPVFSQHQFEGASEAPLEFGESCSKTGHAGCKAPGVCLHVGPGVSENWRCSLKCGGGRQCPQGWKCQSLSVSSDVPYCVPRS